MMGNAQDAVKTLENRGLTVQALMGPAGWRYQVKSKNGLEYQLSNDELLELQAQKKLTWNGVVEIATKQL
jgi:hypothetical protein